MNLTAMSDLTFLLLITFIITFPMIEQGIPVKLPKGKSRQMDAQKKTSSVTVDEEGRVYLGDALVDYDGLARELAARPNTRYYTGHCTGTEAFGILQETLGDRLVAIHGGSEFEI